MKTMLFWCPKGCRKAKMQGLATAASSAATIRWMRTAALERRGRAWIVEASSAAEGRGLIKAHKAGESIAAMVAVLDDGRTVAIGTSAVVAIGGANESLRNWDARIARQGRVTIEQSKALTGDLEADMLRGLPGGVVPGRRARAADRATSSRF